MKCRATRNDHTRKLKTQYLTSTGSSFHSNWSKFLSLHPKLKKIYLTCLSWNLNLIKHFMLFHFISVNTDKKEILFYTALNTNQTLEINIAFDRARIFYWTLNYMEDSYSCTEFNPSLILSEISHHSRWCLQLCLNTLLLIQEGKGKKRVTATLFSLFITIWGKEKHCPLIYWSNSRFNFSDFNVYIVHSLFRLYYLWPTSWSLRKMQEFC